MLNTDKFSCSAILSGPVHLYSVQAKMTFVLLDDEESNSQDLVSHSLTRQLDMVGKSPIDPGFLCKMPYAEVGLNDCM